MPKVGIVHIDVDLYSSTVEVLEFVRPLLVKGSILIFDDWYCSSAGESKGEKFLEEFLFKNEGFSLKNGKIINIWKIFFIIPPILIAKLNEISNI